MRKSFYHSPVEMNAARGSLAEGKGGSECLQIEIPQSMAPQFIAFAKAILQAADKDNVQRITEKSRKKRKSEFNQALKNAFRLFDQEHSLDEVYQTTGIPVATLDFHLKKREKLFRTQALNRRNNRIIKMYLKGKKPSEIAKHYGLSPSAISNITKSVR